MTLANGRTPAHASSPVINPHIDTYAMPYERGSRASRARCERAEIAHERDNERPGHLPRLPEAWEEDWTPAGWWESHRGPVGPFNPFSEP